MFSSTFILPNKSNAYSSDPKQFITEIVDETKKILVETNSSEFKTKRLSEIALETVDIKGIGYYTLGSYRKELSDKHVGRIFGFISKVFFKKFYF